MKNFLFYMFMAAMCIAPMVISCNNDDDSTDNNSSNTGSVPSTPIGVTATAGSSSVTISWSSVSGATDYNVYRSSSPSGTFSQVTTSISTSATDNPTSSGTYYYKVTAVNSAGESSQSSSASCTYTASNGGDNNGNTTKPSAPTGVTASASSSSVTVSWSSVSGATSYNVYRSSSSSGTYSQVTTSSSTSATDNPSSSGTYYYKVAAVNSAGESSQSSSASCTYTASSSATKPAAPTGVSVSNEGNALIPMIAIRWTAVSGATSYKVYRSSSANGSYSQIGSATSSNVLTDNSSNINGTFYYKVKAVNSAGESDYSSYASFTFVPNQVSPCPVTYGSCTATSGSITMRWTAPTSSGCGTPTKALLRVKNANNSDYNTLQTLSGTATSVSFNYGAYVTSDGYVYVGIITENDQGSSGGVPKIYNTKTSKWMN